MFSKIGVEWLNPERFDRAVERALAILPGAPCGLSQADPTGGPVRSASKAFPFDKGFHQPHPVAIAVLPIIG
jgi:hypothetical protein